jgi:hypothetical protein
LSDNFLKLHLEGKHEPNQWMHANVQNVSSDGLVGSAQL